MLLTARGPRDLPSHMHYDVVIVGSGPGGATLAARLASAGIKILVVERGPFLPKEPENWNAQAVFGDARYKTTELWEDSGGKPFRPGMFYYVGGNSKLYGASLPRFRREDFHETAHADGISPAWPVDYEAFAPYYAQAESMYRVHGHSGAGDDPTLVRDQDFPFPAVEHEPAVAAAADRLRQRGFTPSHIPLGVDLHAGGSCLRLSTCDGFPCKVDAKSDAEVCGIRPAMATGNVDLLTEARVTRVVTSPSGDRATGVEAETADGSVSIGADVVVISAGAANSAALLLRSATTAHPDGLANSSGLVGRNYMIHNNSLMLAVRPFAKNATVFQKTMYLNDFYLKGVPEHPFPLGHIQLIGKLRKEMLQGQRPPAPGWVRTYLTERGLTWWLFTEDLPREENRVTLAPSGRLRVSWKANNTAAHQHLIRQARRAARAAGYPVTFVRGAGVDVNSHQAGTARFGSDPAASVLDTDCRTHDVSNLYVVDSSFFPSLPVMNPALTIIANALRVGDAMAKELASE